MSTSIQAMNADSEARLTEARSGNPYLTVYIIGGRGGQAFNFVGGSDGSMLQKIGVWVGGWQVKAVKIWMTNGKSQQFGNPSGPYQEYAFQPGELITKMSLWGNGAGTRLGAIKFSTNKGGEFFAKMTDWGLKQEYPIDTGSGICVGVMGRSGSDIDSMGFVYVKPLKSSQMIDVNYPTIGFEQANVQMETLKSVTYENPFDEPQSFTFSKTDKLTTKQHWQVTAGLEFSYNVSVKAGIPEVAETTAGWGLKVSVSGTYGMENTEEKTETWTFPINVPPKTSLQCTLAIGKADIDLPYTGKIVMTTTDGSVLQFDVNGTYAGITYTDVKLSLQKV